MVTGMEAMVNEKDKGVKNNQAFRVIISEQPVPKRIK